VKEHVEDALSKGAEILLGSKEEKMGGNFLAPTIITGVTQDMKVSKEETFGPLAPLFKFDNEDDVIAMANDTIFGLASYFYAKDLSRVLQGRRGAGVWHCRCEHRHHLDRGRAVWRRQTVRSGPRRQPPRDRRLSGNEIHLHVGLTCGYWKCENGRRDHPAARFSLEVSRLAHG